MRKRSGRQPRFAAVPNETIDDAPNLDFMALGLLNVLLRHRDGWEITLSEIGDKYGYGRDAMANAMGLLQVARYVVKVRMMSIDGNQWSTEVCVYDTPATDTEMAALLAEVQRDPAVRRAQIIQPTASALEHATKRRRKLQPKKGRQGPSVAVPRVQENPHSDATCGNTEKPEVDPECRDSRQSGDPALFKKTVVKKTKNRPSLPDQGTEEQDGGTDGSDAIGDKEGQRPPVAPPVGATPGVEMLLAIGADQPEFLLTGQTLRDQGLMVTGLLEEGWTAQQLRQVISGRPLPQPIRTSVGAVVSRRLRDAVAGPAPRSVPRLPEQSAYGAQQDDAPTPTPDTWNSAQHVNVARSGECNGNKGMCGLPTVPGYDQCAKCRENARAREDVTA